MVPSISFLSYRFDSFGWLSSFHSPSLSLAFPLSLILSLYVFLSFSRACLSISQRLLLLRTIHEHRVGCARCSCQSRFRKSIFFATRCSRAMSMASASTIVPSALTEDVPLPAEDICRHRVHLISMLMIKSGASNQEKYDQVKYMFDDWEFHDYLNHLETLKQTTRRGPVSVQTKSADQEKTIDLT